MSRHSRVLVLGATGCIGRALIRDLDSSGYYVVGTYRDEIRGDGQPGYRSVPFDRQRGMETLYHALRREGLPLSYDCVFDCANPCGNFPAQLEVERLIVCSSASVYDFRGPLPLKEEDPVVDNVHSALSASAYHAQRHRVIVEKKLMQLARARSIHLTLARLSMVLGPGERYNRVSHWFWRVQSAESIAVPHPTAIGFVDGRDVAALFIKWMSRRLDRGVKIVNLGPPVGKVLPAIKDIVLNIAQLTRPKQFRLNIIPTPLYKDNLRGRDRIWTKPNTPAWRLLHLCDKNAVAEGFASRDYGETIRDEIADMQRQFR